MKTYLLCLWMFLSITITLQSQSLGEFKPSIMKHGLKKLKKAPKKIYISMFNIHFETYKEDVAFKAGGSSFGSTIRSNAKATAAIGLDGIIKGDIQNVVNKLYEEYVSTLKNKGYTIISADEAGKTAVYENWKKADGPYVIESGLPGIMVGVPKDYSFYYKRENKKGKKSKGFLNGVGVPANLSKQLGDATIAEVDLYVMFTESKEDLFKGNAAKVKMLTNYRVVGSYYVSKPSEAKVRFGGAKKVDRISTKVSFYQGKIGAGVTSSYDGSVRNDLNIEGVIKKEKVVAYQKQGSSTPTSFAPFYSEMDLANRFSATAKWIKVDSNKYTEGLYLACKKVINEHTISFFKESGI